MANALPRRFPRSWYVFRSNPKGMVSLFALGALVLAAFLAPAIAPYQQHAMGDAFVPPSPGHLLGTDSLGEDVLTNILYGARISLLVGFLAVVTSTTVGVLVGAVAGYFGGAFDHWLMRFTEMFQVLPQFFLAIVIVALFGASIWNIVLVIGLLTWPVTARLLRAEFLTLRKREFIDAARSQGMSDTDIILRELLPNALPPLVVNCTLQISAAILLETSLSFLGLGDPSVMSWGTMLHDAQDYFSRAWWMAAFPGLSLFLTTLSLNLIGDGLNDALNPKDP